MSEPSPPPSLQDIRDSLVRSIALLDPDEAPSVRERRIILAVSGGPDSLALLLAAADGREAFAAAGIHFLVATVDHGLRAESAAEAAFVADLSVRSGLPHRTARWTGEKPGGNRQAAARAARYRLLADIAREEGAVAVMTAHHQDDQIETHLLAALRKAGPRGLAGMRARRDLEPGLHLFRPFLDVPAARLRLAVERSGLRPVDDPSNRDERYRRVRLRKAAARGEVDRGAVLAEIARHQRAREIEDARLAAALSGLMRDGSLTVRTDAAVELDRDGFGALDEDLRPTLLGRLIVAVGGGEHPPLRLKIERLAEALGGGGKVAATLGGVAVAAGPVAVFAREYGRRGPDAVPLSAVRATVLFDRRFDVGIPDLAEAAAGAALAPFGRLGRGNRFERTQPVLLSAEGAVLAAPTDLLPKLPEGTRRLELAERVTWRILADLPAAASPADSCAGKSC